MNNDNKKLNTTQEYLLKLLEFVHSICVKNNIKYSLDCGTLIGAVRESGFIAWDDDADIIFTRREYDKFLKVLKSIDLPDFVGIYEPETKKYFFDFNVRLYYKKERIRTDEYSVNLYDGIYSYATLDIFILDNIPTNRLKNRLYVLAQQFVFGLAMSKRQDIKYNKYSFIERVAILVLNTIGKLFDIVTLCNIHHKYSIEYFDKTDKYYCTSWSPEYPGYQFDKNLFEEYIFTRFENLELYITKEYDKVLRIEYGNDYMTPKVTHDHENYSKEL